MTSEVPTPRETPWWVVVLVFVVVPIALAFVISRQAAAQVVRRKAIASSHGWAIENKNEGQRAWIVRGAHQGLEFEAVSRLREGGGAAWRLRVPVARQFDGWTLISFGLEDFRAADFGTISTLVTRDSLPTVVASPGLPGASWAGPLVTAPGLAETLAPRPAGPFAVSLVDDGVVLDGAGELPEGEALVPYLDLAVRVGRWAVSDGG